MKSVEYGHGLTENELEGRVDLGGSFSARRGRCHCDRHRACVEWVQREERFGDTRMYARANAGVFGPGRVPGCASVRERRQELRAVRLWIERLTRSELGWRGE
jgi:hypothetical protein